MKQTILKNNTDQEIELTNLGGIVLEASSTRDISEIYFDLIVNADDLRDAVASGTITINDGTSDMLTSRALTYMSYEDAAYIQGIPVVQPEHTTLAGGFTMRYKSDEQNWIYDTFRLTELGDVVVDEDSGTYVVVNSSGTGPLTPYNEFTDLDDTPSDYTGQVNKMVVVKSDGTGLEFVDIEFNGETGALDMKIYLVVDSVGYQTITQDPIILNLDSIVINNSNYTLSNDEIIVNESGYYDIDYFVAWDEQNTSGGTRATISTWVQKYSGTWSTIPGSYGRDYHREATDGGGTGTSFPVYITEGEKIRVQFENVYTSSPNFRTIPDHSKLAIKKLDPDTATVSGVVDSAGDSESDSFWSETTNQSSTTSTSWTQRMRLAVTPNYSGDYMIDFSTMVSHEDTGVFCELRIQINDSDTTREIHQEFYNFKYEDGAYHCWNGKFTYSFIKGQVYNIDMDYASGDSGKAMYLKESVIEVRRLTLYGA